MEGMQSAARKRVQEKGWNSGKEEWRLASEDTCVVKELRVYMQAFVYTYINTYIHRII
jgi:hypothetical protein